MKPLWIAFFILLMASPAFSLEDIAEYDEVTIDIAIAGEFHIKKGTESGLVRDLEAQLLFFPITAENQHIQSLENDVDAKGAVTENETTVRYFWEIPNGTVGFRRVASVDSASYLIQIKEKIDFPLLPYDLPPEIRIYLNPSPKIDITREMKEKAESIAAGETDLYVVAHRIASWVHDYVNYTLNQQTEFNVLPSSWVFENGIGVCDEISNLFVSMMRSIGVPARFVSGIVYSNTDLGFGNHGWAEVYFLGHGWIPFDPTFGQYGYIDPGHIKFQDSTDSGVSALAYRWKSRDATVSSDSLNVSAVLREKKSHVKKIVNISVTPYEREVNFGSYLPIRVTVKNLADYYVPVQVYVTKSPKIIGKTQAYVLLKPREEKDVYFLAEIEPDLDSEYLYKSLVEAKTNWLTVGDASIEYHREAPFISKIEADTIIALDEEREQKEFFSDVDIYCDTEKKSYYPDEKMNITCATANSGNTPLSLITVCLEESCEEISLGLGGYQEFSYQRWPKKEFTFSVETPDKFKEKKIVPSIINIPVVSLSNFTPTSLSYGETATASFIVEQKDTDNLAVFVNGKKVSVVDKKGELLLSGKEASMGVLVEIHYKDAAGKEYSLKKRLSVEVNDLPLYLRLKRFLIGLFYTNA